MGPAGGTETHAGDAHGAGSGSLSDDLGDFRLDLMRPFPDAGLDRPESLAVTVLTLLPVLKEIRDRFPRPVARGTENALWLCESPTTRTDNTLRIGASEAEPPILVQRFADPHAARRQMVDSPWQLVANLDTTGHFVIGDVVPAMCYDFIGGCGLPQGNHRADHLFPRCAGHTYHSGFAYRRETFEHLNDLAG